MELSATGPELSEYHVESAIASLHTSAVRAEDTDWSMIVSLYDTLMSLRPSPIIALNRAIAISQREGPERGIEEIGKIVECERLSAYPFYPAALGELELLRENRARAREHFDAARAIARNPMEREFFERRIAACS